MPALTGGRRSSGSGLVASLRSAGAVSVGTQSSLTHSRSPPCQRWGFPTTSSTTEAVALTPCYRARSGLSNDLLPHQRRRLHGVVEMSGPVLRSSSGGEYPAHTVVKICHTYRKSQTILGTIKNVTVRQSSGR